MSRSRLRTLKQIAGERPRCQYCGKELKPVTCTVEVTGHITDVPAIDELLRMQQPNPTWPTTSVAVERGYRPEFVFRMTHKSQLEPRSPSRCCTSGPARIRATDSPTRPSCSATTTVAACSASLPGGPVTA